MKQDMLNNKTEDKNPLMEQEQYHEIKIHEIKVISNFRHIRKRFAGIIVGYDGDIIIRLTNIGKRAFPGGRMIINQTSFLSSGGSSGGYGKLTVDLPRLESGKEITIPKSTPFPNPADEFDFYVDEIIGNDSVLAKIQGIRRLHLRPIEVEEARSQISNRTRNVITLIGASIAATAGIVFGLINAWTIIFPEPEPQYLPLITLDPDALKGEFNKIYNIYEVRERPSVGVIRTTVIATIANEGNATAKDFKVRLGHSPDYNVWWNFGTGQAILDDRVIPLKAGAFTFNNLFPAERGYIEFNVEIDPVLYDQVTKQGDIPLMFFEVTYSELDEPQKFEYCVEIHDYRCPRLT